VTGNSQPLRFSRVVLQNWKNFGRVDVSLPRRVFLAGPNASGKSNFLDVFRFLGDIASSGGGFQEAVRRRGGVSAIRCLTARRYSDIGIRVLVDSGDSGKRWEYELTFNQDKQRRPTIRKERVAAGEVILLERPNDEDRQDPERLTQTYLEQVSANRPFRELAAFVGSVQYLHIVPQLVREPDRTVWRTSARFGGDFLEALAKTPEKTRNARLRRIRDALRVAAPQLAELELWRDVRGTPHLRGRYDHWRPQGAWQTEEQLSYGTLRLMGLLWATMAGGGPLLLEEPELSLHPEVVRYLPQMFARAQRRSGRQIILSTHSPELLRDDGIGLDEVLLLIPGDKGTKVKPASDIANAPQLLAGGSALADVVMPKTRGPSADERRAVAR